MAEKSIFLNEFNIPDDSSHDGVVPSMWGSYLGDGKLYKFYCVSCFTYIIVRFPRWDKILSKTCQSKDVVSGLYRCPCCIKNVFIEIGEE